MALRDLLFPPGATRHDWAIDAAMATGLALLTIPTSWTTGSVSTPALISSFCWSRPWCCGGIRR